jgi:hypothetical protein
MPTIKTRPPAPPKMAGRWPSCPRCTRKMTVKQVTPVLFASTVDDVIYGCEDCGTTVKRTVRRS